MTITIRVLILLLRMARLEHDERIPSGTLGTYTHNLRVIK